MHEAAKRKLIKTSTVPTSLDTFCRGQLKMLSRYYEVVAVSSPLKELDDIRIREGVRCEAVPMERHISIIKDFKSLVGMIRLFCKEKPYIVHSMTPKAGLISMVAAWITRVPIRIHTYTGLVFPTSRGIQKFILIVMDKILCHCATYINPEGYGVANDLRQITKKPLHIIGHGNVRGIDIDYWKRGIASPPDSQLLKKIEGHFVFLFVGRLVKDKGINELVAAFKRLQCEKDGEKDSEKDAKVSLLLVGRFEESLDPLRPETIHEIKENEDIIAVGEASDVRPYYDIADAFVFPSYREGFPNTVLEAGAMGLAQIVTDINGANEIIKDKRNGLIIPPKSEDDILGAMRTLLKDSALREKMSENARNMVTERFEQKYIWSELLKTYESLVSEAGKK